MQSLVIEVSGEARTSTAIIASGVEQPHHSVITLVRKYLPMLMQIGRVEFEIQPFKTNGGTQKRELAWLNEHQATFLITLMRNTEKNKPYIKIIKKNTLIYLFFIILIFF